MPWHVVADHSECGEGKFAVVKDADGQVVACHTTRKEADSHVAALYANTPDAGRAQMSAASINDLPDSAFAYIEPGGKKDAQGKTVPRSLRHFPIHDKAHVQNTLSRAPQSPFGEKAMPKIRAAAKKFGIQVSDDSGRAEPGSTPFVRSFPLQDISIRAGGDGRTVDAYATVFDTPVPIHDQDGDYIEVIDRRAFDRILPKLAPSGGRATWRVGVFYNHGMTLHGTPSDRNSMPIGVPLEIKADGHGLFTRTRYSKGADIDRILDAISEGSLSAYSFSGRFDRSDPMPPRGGFRPDRRGNLPTVRRTESTLREYGPTPFPAYQDAAIVGVRAEQISEQLNRITELLRSGAPLDSPPPSGAPEWDSPPEDSHQVRSGRSVKEELQAARSAFLQKYGSGNDRRNQPRRPV
jgi:HK97 family phage prohead protease